MVPDREPGGYWRGPAAFIALGGIFAGIILWITWDLSALETRERVEAEQAASQYAQGAEERITHSCADASVRDFVKCVYEQTKATHENQRAEYDLAAQEGMFRWARYMTAVSALGAIVTGGGIIFVWLNLREARKATAAATSTLMHAKETSRVELRAYITVEPDGVNKLWNVSRMIGHVVVRNVGKLPAHNVSVYVRMEIRDRDDIAENRSRDFGAEGFLSTVSVDRTIQPGGFLAQGSSDKPMTTDTEGGEFHNIYVWGIVRYHDGYAPDAFTCFCHRYSLASRTERSRTFDMIGGDGFAIIEKKNARYHTNGNSAT